MLQYSSRQKFVSTGSRPPAHCNRAKLDSCGSANEKKSDDKKAIGAVLRGDDDEVHARTLAGEQEIDIVVARDLVRQTALEDRQSVAKANHDVASEIFLCLQEQTMRILGWMLWREGF